MRNLLRAAGLLMLILWTGCAPGLLTKPRPPRFIQVAVQYLPSLGHGSRPQFPPTPVLVLLPDDQRTPYPVHKGQVLPVLQDNTAILGIWGINAKEGVVRINSDDLGAQRRMKAGISQMPDVPRGIFATKGLSRLVQDAIENHLHEGGFPVRKVDFSFPHEAQANREPAQYAVGCRIERFLLVSLERHYEKLIYTPLHAHTVAIPIRGPTQAEVILTITLYKWPSGEVLWTGKVAHLVDDPPRKESEFLYASPGEVVSVAFSRAVGNILVTESLQEVLLTR